MNSEIKEKDDLYIANTYKRFPVHIIKGDGSKLYDDEDNEYIDFTAGIGVNALGHNNQSWQQAVIGQIKAVAHTSNLYYTTPDIQVAEKLCKMTGMKKVFFANSGAEANEGSIKCARKYAHDKYGEERYEIVTLVNSFHGRTITGLSATGQDGFHTNFAPFTTGFKYAEANNIDAMKNAIDKHTLGVMLEMIQGEGGVIPLNKEYVQEVAKLCKKHDLVLIVDEVQTGIGRCGSLFAYEQFDIDPDIVSCAKGLGGGLPIGAILMNEKMEHVFSYGDHGSTFGGNPVACAGANVVLGYMKPKFLEDVQEKGKLFAKELKKLPHVKNVVGLSLMIGVQLDDDINVSDVANRCVKKGLLILTAKSNLRLLPPLVITEEEIMTGIKILEKVLSEM